MNVKVILFGTIIFFVLLSINTVGLAMAVKYGYLNDISHQKQDVCNIVNCTATEKICKRAKTYTYTCYDISLFLELNNTMVNYHYTYTYSICGQSTITCYYDDRNMNTLSLVKKTSTMIILIVFLSVFQFMLLLIYPIFLVVMMHENENLNENVNIKN
jgi:hypothetical protein